MVRFSNFPSNKCLFSISCVLHLAEGSSSWGTLGWQGCVRMKGVCSRCDCNHIVLVVSCILQIEHTIYLCFCSFPAGCTPIGSSRCGTAPRSSCWGRSITVPLSTCGRVGESLLTVQCRMCVYGGVWLILLSFSPLPHSPSCILGELFVRKPVFCGVQSEQEILQLDIIR